MIDLMPHPRPPYLQHEKRRGRRVWIVRINKGPKIRLRGEFGTEQFWKSYNAAVAGHPLEVDAAATMSQLGAADRPKSLAWLIDRYRDSGAWRGLSIATRGQRENIFKHVIKTGGKTPFASIKLKHIQEGIDRRSQTPFAAKHFRSAMRGLCKWAVSAQHVEKDPTQGSILPRATKTGGHKPWGEEWCAAYEARWLLGTRQRVWYEVIHCTGLRRSDAVCVGRQHVREVRVPDGRGGFIMQRRAAIRAAKNGETAYFIVSDRLWTALQVGPVGELTWICGARGKPLTKESFGNLFREACDKAGVVGSAHGIRKTRAIMEAEGGASGAKLDALFGWRTGSKTSAIYIQSADRSKLAFGPTLEEPNGNVTALTWFPGEGRSAKTS